eukprot:c46737_g1_i1.p1 GENE.c46737_g1_i1~~c46737_g1_i1.p1  ORF type:complete len:212 (+),score=47.40 c46737_g1_i1:582-1217(+)
MYPTRVPYEESSVFSDVNVMDPDLSRHPRFENARQKAIEIVLVPGDVLFVPPRYWHFVQCLTPAISTNVWLELPTDNLARVKEALVRVVLSLCSPYPLSSKPVEKDDSQDEEAGNDDNCSSSSAALEWVNPGAEIWDVQTSVSALQQALEAVGEDSTQAESIGLREVANALLDDAVLEVAVDKLKQRGVAKRLQDSPASTARENKRRKIGD